ncbi:MAG: ParB/RepB/Spo0J family partition protein [Planctomycetaceae bacterium]
MTRLAGAFIISIDRIRPDPSQPRRTFSDTALQELTQSLCERGIRQPIRVRHEPTEDLYWIVSGERRYRAAILAGLKEIPCIIDGNPSALAGLDAAQLLLDQIAENWQREDLLPLELSDALRELQSKLNLSQEEIARRLGKSKGDISKLLSMQHLSGDLREELRNVSGPVLSRRHLIAIAKLPKEKQQAFVTKIEEQKLTAEQTEREAASMGGRSQRRSKGAVIRSYSVGTQRLTMTFPSSDGDTIEQLRLLDTVRKRIEANRM